LLDPRFGINFTALLQEPATPGQQPTRHTTRDGRVVYVNWSVRLLEDASGARAGLIGIGIDVTENQRTVRAIGLLAQAGTRSSEVFTDIARVLLTGLDCAWAGIVESGDREGAAPHLLALLDRRGSRLADDAGDLAQALAAVTADGHPVTVSHDLARLHPRLAQLPGGMVESLFAEPLRDRNDRVIGCVFAAHVQALQPTAAGLNLLQLVARRLVLELQRMNDELLLTRARDTALAATEAKSRFLANVSHEIRTPMNGIIGFSRLLMREQLSGRQHGQVEMIQQSAQSLLTIINDILDLSKIEAGKLTVTHEPFELVDTLEELIAVFAVQAHQKGLELCHELDGSLPLTVMGDSQRLTQILTNLLGNAVKFTDQGVISLRAHRTGDGDAPRLLLEVVDSGIGIAAEARERLFRAFSQVDSTAARRHSGTGLGLAISKQLVELLGGSIGVASTPGQGSRFWVDLPLEAVGQACVSDRAGVLLDGLDVVLYEHEPVSRAAAASLLGLSGARVRAVADSDGLTAALAEPTDLVVVGQPVDEEASRLCLQRLPALRADFAGPVLVLTCDSINPVDAERCRGCSEWCRPKPLLLKTLELGHSRRFGGPDTVTQETRWLAGRRLVVADDNAVNRALIVTLLTQQGATVIEAGDGAEAVAAISDGCDLVFMDLQMPGMSGLEAAARLREQLGPACPPLIALTASAMAGERQRSLDAGLHDHLTKPLDEEKLLRVLRTWLGGVPPLRPAADGDAAATPPATPEPVHDAAGALAITGGRGDLAQKMLDLFLSEVPQHRTALAEGWRSGDLVQLRSMLHKLRGSAEYCALRRLSQAVGRAEEALAAGSLGPAELLLDAVRKELDDAAAEAERQAQARADPQG
jgi:two-component system sensor histidine kinase BarA